MKNIQVKREQLLVMSKTHKKAIKGAFGLTRCAFTEALCVPANSRIQDMTEVDITYQISDSGVELSAGANAYLLPPALGVFLAPAALLGTFFSVVCSTFMYFFAVKIVRPHNRSRLQAL